MIKHILIILAIILLGNNVYAGPIPSTPSTYISYVDDILGFYKVRNLDQPPRYFTYTDHILNINQGDTVIWQNDAEKSTFTILSDQNLWDKNVGYLRIGSKMNYKFDNPGKYTIYIKEHSSVRQTIIVGGKIIDTTPKITSTNPIPTTYTVTPNYNASYNDNNNVSPKQTNFNIPKIGIASIIVAVLSIFIIYRIGKDK